MIRVSRVVRVMRIVWGIRLLELFRIYFLRRAAAVIDFQQILTSLLSTNVEFVRVKRAII